MRAIYLRRRNLGSLILRTGMWSSWSHCGIVLPGGMVIEAAAFHGVRMRPLAEVLADASAHAFAMAQVGKPYDWLGAIGLAVHRDWERDDAWFCSELVEAAAAAGGRRRFVNQPRRVTPQHSWMVA